MDSIATSYGRLKVLVSRQGESLVSRQREFIYHKTCMITDGDPLRFFLFY